MATIPELKNLIPDSHSTDVSPYTSVSMDVVDTDGDLLLTGLSVDINGETAFNSGVFFSPFDGSYNKTTVDGKDGYHISINSSEQYTDVNTIRVIAYDALLNKLDSKSSFVVGENINTLYFSDGYGLKKIFIKNLIGDCQEKVETLFESPVIPSKINYISGQKIDNNFYLVLSTDTGVYVIKNDIDIELYNSGKIIRMAEMNEDGTLYALNETNETLDVYYGAYFRSGARPSDFSYNSALTPTPEILLTGTGSLIEMATCIHVVSNASSKCDTCSKIYIGTTEGVTVLDAYDYSNNGFSTGLESTGESATYSISTGVGTHKIIGGTVKNVVSVSSIENPDIFLVVTDDGHGVGGTTQILENNAVQLGFYNTEDLGASTSERVVNSVFVKK